MAVRVWLSGGVRIEEIPGQAFVSARALVEGSERRDWTRISEEAEAIGCSVVTEAGRSMQTLALDGLASEWEQLLDWAAELVYEASFPGARCDWVRRQATAELESLRDLPEVRTGWSLLEQLYPDHPFGRPIQGTPEGLARLSEDDCRSFHRRCLSSGSLCVAVAGDIQPSAVEGRLEELFGGREAVGVDTNSHLESAATGSSLRRVELEPGDQAHICLGSPTVCRGDADFEALRLLGIVLGSGDGLVGRIPARIREEEGLAYACEVDTVAGAGLERGHLLVKLATSASRLDEALGGLQEELERARQEGVTETELEEARLHLAGREPFRRETARQWAELLVEASFLQLPVERVEWVNQQLRQVTLDRLNQVAFDYLDSSKLAIALGVPS